LIKPPGITYLLLGKSVILEKLGSTLSQSFLERTKDLEKLSIVKTNLIFEVEPLSISGLRNNSFFGQPSLVSPILISLVRRG
jgi:hypothetical protein